VKRLLLIGGNSRFGVALIGDALSHGWTVGATSRTNPGNNGPAGVSWRFLDLTIRRSIDDLTLRDFDHVILLAAQTSIRDCELHPFASRQVNVIGTSHLIKKLDRHMVPFTFISSRQVFGPWQYFPLPKEERRPECEYGHQKRVVEDLVFASGFGRVLRMTKVLSTSEPLFDSWIIAANNGSVMKAFSNVSISPITQDFAVGFVLRSVENEGSARVLHATAPDEVSYADAAQYILSLMGRPSELLWRAESDGLPDGGVVGPHAALGLSNPRDASVPSLSAIRMYFDSAAH